MEGFHVLKHSPGAPQSPRGRNYLCAQLPLRFFTSPYAFDLCKVLTFLPAETMIKTIFKIFFCLIQLLGCLHLEKSFRAPTLPSLWTSTASKECFSLHFLQNVFLMSTTGSYHCDLCSHSFVHFPFHSRSL